MLKLCANTLSKLLDNNCASTMLSEYEGKGTAGTAHKVAAAFLVTAAFNAAAACLPVTKAETRPTLSRSALSVNPHVPQDTVTPPTDP